MRTVQQSMFGSDTSTLEAGDLRDGLRPGTGQMELVNEHAAPAARWIVSVSLFDGHVHGSSKAPAKATVFHVRQAIGDRLPECVTLRPAEIDRHGYELLTFDVADAEGRAPRSTVVDVVASVVASATSLAVTFCRYSEPWAELF